MNAHDKMFPFSSILHSFVSYFMKTFTYNGAPFIHRNVIMYTIKLHGTHRAAAAAATPFSCTYIYNYCILNNLKGNAAKFSFYHFGEFFENVLNIYFMYSYGV